MSVLLAMALQHWAFEPPKRVPGSIDRFIEARLGGLKPAPEASRETLLRRVTLDLTGLPPTLEELDAFLADGDYGKVVDRLLASPRYGERMVWEWLEAARYADTNGYQGDGTRTMWPWRDWAIDALNRNMPFDQFTVEQIAGDLLPGATPSQRLATGFHRNHMLNGEGGRIAEESRVDYVVDRVDTTATVWLGLTLGCARCHDHKFDPFTQREYYRLFAYFNSVAEDGSADPKPVLAHVEPGKEARMAAAEARVAEATAKLAAAAVDPPAEWEAAERARTPLLGPWRSAGPISYGSFDAAHAAALPEKPDWKERPEFGDGKVHPFSGDNSALLLVRTITAADAMTLPVSLGSDDSIQLWLNDEKVLDKKVTRAAAADQEKVALKLKAGENRLLMKIVNGGGLAGFIFKAGDDKIAAILAAAPRTEEQRKALASYYGATLPAGREAKAALEAARRELDALRGSAVNVMVMADQPKPRETFVLVRGAYDKRGEKVAAGVPAVLPLLPEGATPNRLALARWLVDPANPLTARVAVNRAWQLFFGAGLVRTPEDFGTRGERPSHPELLDWLAVEFVASGWDVKALHRKIVTSAAYKRSARVTPELLERDPENRLMARGPRFRLSSAALRDQALALGGLLVEKVGGPPVRPYQPAGVWEEATFGTIRYAQDRGEALYRRSVYTFWRRIVGPTMLFDTPSRQSCSVRPSRTNSPLHALTLMNDVTYVEAARAFGERVLRRPAPERIEAAFRMATARRPKAAESAILASRLAALREHFAADPKAAAALLAVGESPRDTSLDAAEAASWAALCGLILNLDETITRE